MYLERIPIHLPDPEKQEKGKVDEWVNNTRNQLMLYSQLPLWVDLQCRVIFTCARA